MPSGRHNRTKYAKDRNHPRANPAWRPATGVAALPYVGPTKTKVDTPDPAWGEQTP